MPKLHEVLAVEGDLAGTAKKLLDEARDTFAKKPTHFQGVVSATSYFDDAKSMLNTTTQTAITTTVEKKVNYFASAVAKFYDTYATKEATNQEARADVLLPDGSIFMPDVPATVLLGMETKLKELRSVYEAIPTLEPGVEWRLTPDEGTGIYQTVHPVERFITEKTVVPVELSPATKEHKAQVQVLSQDVPVAKRLDTKTSGMVTPATKSELLGNIDVLIRAFKEARQRANSTEIKQVKDFGRAIFDYINKPLKEVG